jgi:hypothetical protein
MTSLLNFSLLLYAIAKVGVVCGLLPGIAIAMFFEKCRVIEFGVETVFRGEQLATLSDADSSWATSSPRKVRCA